MVSTASFMWHAITCFDMAVGTGIFESARSFAYAVMQMSRSVTTPARRPSSPTTGTMPMSNSAISRAIASRVQSVGHVTAGLLMISLISMGVPFISSSHVATREARRDQSPEGNVSGSSASSHVPVRSSGSTARVSSM